MEQTEILQGKASRESDRRPPGGDIPWHSLSAGEAPARLGSDPRDGLSTVEARRRQREYGPNRLVKERRVTFWAVAREEVTEPMILLLLGVGVIYSLLGELRDAVAIFAIIAGIVFVEVFNEYRAKAAIAALQRMAAPDAVVVRDGRRERVPAVGLVPGDVVVLSPGERVPSDIRLLEASGLRVDESSLTGESVPVAKGVEAVAPAAELGDRRDMAYASTLVTAGKGRGLVVAVGMATEVGRIAGLVSAAREPRTPLQVAMRQLSGALVWLAVGFSVLIPALGLLFGQPLREMVLTGLTLAFATIPEELPILITVVLGLGAVRLSRRHAIVKRLRAAETLGSVSAIATDKTGTITENRMALAELRLPGSAEGLSPVVAGETEVGRRLLELGALANDAPVQPAGGEDGFLGDPTDVALLMGAREGGLDPEALRGAGPVEEYTFDDRRKLMSALYVRDGELLVAAKGAPESILSRSERWLVEGGVAPLSGADRRAALASADDMAARGLRVLALAYKTLPGNAAGRPGRAGGDQAAQTQAESDLIFAGLAGLLDPPRPEVPQALAQLSTAGIRVLMVTGDHPATARAVARAVGIDGDRCLSGRDLDALSDEQLADVVENVAVYARIAPEHKLRVVRALQARGQVVAVTGDGVNDAPALKEAAIGVAMGETGTDTAKEAAGMVLADDNFATIAVAVREGRRLYANLYKAVRYYLGVKVALVTSSLVAVLAHLPVPLTPAQIIVTELFMDLGASVTFTAEPAEGDVMKQPPRDPRRPFMDGPMRAGIFAGGLSLSAAVVAAYLWALWRGADALHAQSVAFATWMLGHVILALHMRSLRQPLLRGGLLSNPAMVLWALGTVAALLLVTNVPLVGQAVRTTPLGAEEWVVAILFPAVSTVWWEAWKLWRWRR